jgi:hypothetical protein
MFCRPTQRVFMDPALVHCSDEDTFTINHHTRLRRGLLRAERQGCLRLQLAKPLQNYCGQLGSLLRSLFRLLRVAKLVRRIPTALGEGVLSKKWNNCSSPELMRGNRGGPRRAPLCYNTAFGASRAGGGHSWSRGQVAFIENSRRTDGYLDPLGPRR